MKIVVINGSPNGKRSVTLRLTNAFLEGLGEEAEIIETSTAKIGNCHACYSCWYRTPGRCVQSDDANEIIDKIRSSDLVVWSVPLYCYSAPACCKVLMDRMLCTNKPQLYIGSDNLAHHVGGFEDGFKAAILISSGGLPDVEGNFDGLVFQLMRVFGPKTQAICCAEGPLFMFPGTEAITAPYLELVKRAGAEYKADGRISEATQTKLDTPMLPREQFIANLNRQ